MHPGTARDEPQCDPGGVCITCGDVALELRVLAIDVDRGLALCADENGRRESVEIALVAPVEAGDRLLVHAGTAITKLAANPAAADAGAEEEAPRRRRGQEIRAGAEQPAGVVR